MRNTTFFIVTTENYVYPRQDNNDGYINYMPIQHFIPSLEIIK